MGLSLTYTKDDKTICSIFTMKSNIKTYINKHRESFKFIFIIFSVITVTIFSFLFFAPVIKAI